MTGPLAPPTSPTVARAAAETEAVVNWLPPTQPPAPSDYRVRWALHNPDPLAGPTAWLGSIVSTACSHRITGLEPGRTYTIEVTARGLGDAGEAILSRPVQTIVSMLAPDAAQDRFFSVMVPTRDGPSYLRIGQPDLSGIEHELLDLAHQSERGARGLGATFVPAARDLGPESTADVVLVSSADVVVKAVGDIRMRALGDIELEATNFTVLTDTSLVNIVHKRGDDGKPDEEAGIVTYEKEFKQIGSWWKTSYDRAHTLEHKMNASGSYHLAGGYEARVGQKLEQTYGGVFESSVSLANVDVTLTGLEVNISLRGLETTLLGNQQEFLAVSGLNAGQIKFELTDEVTSKFSVLLSVFNAVMNTANAIMAVFQTAMMVTRFAILTTARGKETITLDRFLTDTCIPFYLANQSATALMNFAAVALGSAHILDRKINRPKTLDGTFIEMNHAPRPTITLVNTDETRLTLLAGKTTLQSPKVAVVASEDQELLMDGTDIRLKNETGGAGSYLKLLSGGHASLQAYDTIVIDSRTSIVLRCGSNSFEISPSGFVVNGSKIKIETLLNQFGGG